MALVFGVLIVGLVVVGSLLIMADLNDNMMPASPSPTALFRAAKTLSLKQSDIACFGASLAPAIRRAADHAAWTLVP
jgi:hypothetical protein